MAFILVADDAPAAREAVARALGERGHRVVTAANGQEALERYVRERHELVVMAVDLPLLSGLDACARIKGAGSLTPVILTGGRSDLAARLAALAVADDFLARPFELAELCARVEAHLRTRRALERHGPRATVPPTSSTSSAASALPDRASFVERLGDEWRRSARSTDPISVLVVGIDGPRGWPNGGPDGGAATALAATMQRSMRGIDFWCRADERHVAGMLLNTHVTGMMAAVTRLRAELRRASREREALTVSMGAAFHPSREVAEPADLLRLAERAIVRAREEGPGRICFWQHAGYLFDPVDVP